jgi:hypothetical protein
MPKPLWQESNYIIGTLGMSPIMVLGMLSACSLIALVIEIC